MSTTNRTGRRTLALATVTIAAGLALLAAPASAAPAAASTTSTSASAPARITAGAEPDGYQAQVLALTNQARASARKCGGTKMRATKPVTWSTQLAASAEGHSTDMATRDYFSHTNRSGQSPFTRIRSTGYKYKAAGENIAAGAALADPAAAVRAWLDSPAHCKVLMSAKYTQLGVGHAEGGSYKVYVTQNFGKPRK